jgi:hypothetical protein
MSEAIQQSETSTYMLKKLIELALLLLGLQIPIMFASICCNRSKACHGMSNIIWVKNVLVCIGFGWATYYQGVMYQTNLSFCVNYNNGKVEEQRKYV